MSQCRVLPGPKAYSNVNRLPNDVRVKVQTPASTSSLSSRSPKAEKGHAEQEIKIQETSDQVVAASPLALYHDWAEKLDVRSKALSQSSRAQDLRPVFRSSPYDAEAAWTSMKRCHARILVLDEGNCCRSVLAEAMFNKVLQNMQFNGTPLSVVVESASLGPSFPQHDPRVIRLAREAGLKLAPKNTRSFKEVRDTVEYDLILVMDRFDFEEVMREVAVLDSMNPGGYYSARIRLFGPFAAASPYFKPKKAPWAFGEGIEDPLYGNGGGVVEQAALWGTLRKLRLACAGLAQFIHQLQDGHSTGASLPQALLQALLCPLLGPGVPSTMQNSAWEVPLKEKDWRPVWRGGGEVIKPQIYTTRKRGGRRFVVRQPSTYYTVQRGYWTDIDNVRKELQTLIANKNLDRHTLPSNKQLRELGANQLCNAIEYHGGFAQAADKLGAENLKAELESFIREGEVTCSPDDLPYPVACMPSLKQLKDSSRPDLLYAVLRWGGVAAAAKLVGIPTRKSRHKMLMDSDAAALAFSRAEEDLKHSFARSLARGVMPSKAEIIGRGYSELAKNIQRAGGFKEMAATLKLIYTRSPSKSSVQILDRGGL